MAYDVVDREIENAGSMYYERVTLNITSLENAGAEAVAAAAVAQSVSRVVDASVTAQEDASYQVEYDHVNDQIQVVNVSDATDVAANTAVGEVTLKVVGR